MHAADLSPDALARWQQAYDAGVAKEETNAWTAALAQYQAAAAIDGRYADLHYRMARCFATLRQHESARARYAEAVEHDALRFRADRRTNETIRRVGSDPAPAT